LATEQVAIDLHGKNIPTPAILKTLSGIPEPLLLVFELVQHDHGLPPGQLGSAALHYLLIGVGEGKSPHVADISRGKATHVWEGGFQIFG
jgi:hypothetical protein